MFIWECWTFLRWTKAAAGSARSVLAEHVDELLPQSHTLNAARPGLVGGMSMRTVAG